MIVNLALARYQAQIQSFSKYTGIFFNDCLFEIVAEPQDQPGHPINIIKDKLRLSRLFQHPTQAQIERFETIRCTKWKGDGVHFNYDGKFEEVHQM
jgi:hypothetical protein